MSKPKPKIDLPSDHDVYFHANGQKRENPYMREKGECTDLQKSREWEKRYNEILRIRMSARRRNTCSKPIDYELYFDEEGAARPYPSKSDEGEGISDKEMKWLIKQRDMAYLMMSEEEKEEFFRHYGHRCGYEK